jgi:hypothetical protein
MADTPEYAMPSQDRSLLGLFGQIDADLPTAAAGRRAAGRRILKSAANAVGSRQISGMRIHRITRA